ncbi:MAG TPA: prepilin-type N-terminal cleavage/methylation domain-containing protein [Lacunisphaera sp.]|nr:prepilin-type N-terminal cleavage/methylation domain-containing protein [Lacunisphaera sp.]
MKARPGLVRGSVSAVIDRRCRFTEALLSARANAFSLVEVLVSLAIFGLAAVVLGTAYVNVLVNYQQMEQLGSGRTEIAMARADLLAEPDRAKVERGGEVPLVDGGQLRWQAKLAETTVADLFEVTMDLEIAPPGRAAPRRQHETFLLLRPTWSDPAKQAQLRAATKARLEKRRF